jgi:hypothetical protein
MRVEERGIAVAVVIAIVIVIAAVGVGSYFLLRGGELPTGTAENPYMITTVEQLQEMENNLTAYYALGNDIDASDTLNWNGGAGFEPIGTNENRFTGSLDGRGYEIYDLYINRVDTGYVGLFGYVGSGGVVENVGLENEDLSGDNHVGGLVGYNNGKYPTAIRQAL